METGTLLELLQAGAEEAWRLQAAEHDEARDGQTQLQNPEDQLTVLAVSKMGRRKLRSSRLGRREVGA